MHYLNLLTTVYSKSTMINNSLFPLLSKDNFSMLTMFEPWTRVSKCREYSEDVKYLQLADCYSDIRRAPHKLFHIILMHPIGNILSQLYPGYIVRPETNPDHVNCLN